MTSAYSEFTERETAIIDALTERFKTHSLDAHIVDVNTSEGGEKSTLRLTLDTTSSTDFSRGRIAASESVDALVDEAAAERGAGEGDRTMTTEYEPGHDAIARRAYAIYESRGRMDGRHEDDWAEAEAQLAGQAEAPSEFGAGPNVPIDAGSRGERAGEVMPEVSPTPSGEQPEPLPPPGV